MSTEVKHRRGTAAQHASFTGAEAEITYDSTNKALRVHDGVTAGGEIVSAPYLEQTAKALQLIPWSMRDDILSGAPALDHTASLAAIWTDSRVKRAVEFPSNGVFNVDHVRLPVGTVAREFIFGGSKFRQMADRTSGGQFLRLMQPTSIGAYGSWDDITIDGGVFDLDGKVQWSAIAWLPYMRRAVVRDLTVIHRTVAMVPVTLDATTDIFSASGHPFANGDCVVVVSGQYSVPGGHPGSGTRFFVINRTADTFQLSLTSGGAAFNFTSAGAGVLVQPYVNWGMVVGGHDVQVINPRVLNGSCLYQDGLHIIHGAGIGVLGGYVESGDDALALGFEIDPAIPDLEIRDVSVSGLRVKAAMATAVKVYAPSGSGRTVAGAELEVIGESGMFRNGGVAFDGDYGTPLIDQFAPIRDIRVRANLTVGSVGRTQLNQPFIVKFTGCTNCHVDGQFRILGDDTLPWDEIYAERALDCSLTGEITKRDAQMDSTIDGATTRNVVSSIPPVYVAPVAPVVVTNLLANPWGSGGTPSAVPVGWRPSSGNNGLTMEFLYSEPDADGYRKVAYRLAGTTTANSTAILCPNANSAVAFDPAKAAVSFKWGVQIEGAVPAGMTITLAVAGLASDGNTILENTDLGIAMMVGRSMERFEVSRTMINAGTEFLRGQLAYVIPTGSVVDLVIWTHQPMLTED